MKLLPFTLKKVHGQLEMVHLCLFLANGGRTLWSIEEKTITKEAIMQDYLSPNGFVPLKIQIENDIVFARIDVEKTKMADFYTWEEAYKHPGKPECWRSFYFFYDVLGAEWFSGKQIQGEGEVEGISIAKYYEDILRLFTE